MLYFLGGCPTDMSTPTSGFREINGKCYYMTKGGCHKIYNGCTFQQAQDQCKTVFGPGISGHLFEPISLEINNAVLKAAKDVMGHSRWFWIGQNISTSSSEAKCIGAVSGTQKWITYCWKHRHLYTICETNFYLSNFR
jgi:hypothetical protein